MSGITRILVIAAVLVSLTACDSPGRPPGGGLDQPVVDVGGNGGQTANGIPIDLGGQLFTEGEPVENVEAEMRRRIGDVCEGKHLPADCVQVERIEQDAGPAPQCSLPPEERTTEGFLAYIGMSVVLPSGGVGPPARLNSGETLFIYAQQCQPAEVVDPETTDPSTGPETGTPPTDPDIEPTDTETEPRPEPTAPETQPGG